MMRFTKLVLLAGVVLGCAPVATRADDLSNVETAILEAWKPHKSLTAKMSMVTAVDTLDNVVTRGTGTFELMKQDDKVLVRMELTTTARPAPGSTKTPPQAKMTAIIDGKFAYLLTEQMGRKMGRKANMDPKMTGDPKLVLQALRKEFELRVLPQQTIDGGAAYVIECTPRTQGERMPMTITFYFSKENGAIVRMVERDTLRRTTQTTSFTDIKLDLDLEPGRFVFAPPPGVEMTDMTRKQP